MSNQNRKNSKNQQPKRHFIHPVPIGKSLCVLVTSFRGCFIAFRPDRKFGDNTSGIYHAWRSRRDSEKNQRSRGNSPICRDNWSDITYVILPTAPIRKYLEHGAYPTNNLEIVPSKDDSETAEVRIFVGNYKKKDPGTGRTETTEVSLTRSVPNWALEEALEVLDTLIPHGKMMRNSLNDPQGFGQAYKAAIDRMGKGQPSAEDLAYLAGTSIANPSSSNKKKSAKTRAQKPEKADASRSTLGDLDSFKSAKAASKAEERRAKSEKAAAKKAKRREEQQTTQDEAEARPEAETEAVPAHVDTEDTAPQAAADAKDEEIVEVTPKLTAKQLRMWVSRLKSTNDMSDLPEAHLDEIVTAARSDGWELPETENTSDEESPAEAAEA